MCSFKDANQIADFYADSGEIQKQGIALDARNMEKYKKYPKQNNHSEIQKLIEMFS